MLFLLFRLGKDRYALEAGQIGEVLPLLEVKALPSAPPGVAGVINYHGVPVPVVDLSVLALGRPAESRLSTRIVLTHYAGDDGRPHWLGLIAEYATETIRLDSAAFASSGVTSSAAPYLGPVAPDPRGMIQRIDPAQILPPPIREALFQPLAESLA